ncbi:hypothetical protein DS2_11113 [Catenovulum agarivorans DS-2]|uniref:Uncharacterized protein n=1 Tax=Catenovulum agarivorans DS-2 TaxID=1328313 RepID=W7QL82_9ALTE|nr:DUF692 domain-containing protein [Catenovulum agarivorans]EWH09677.1 hypothetical protein DS2_11113 [Catenovulum agarivorans DS-2]
MAVNNRSQFNLSGAGLGLRRDFIDTLNQTSETNYDFLEIAPENWIKMGGRYCQQLDQVAQRYKLTTHGLSLSIGSPDPLDVKFILQIKQFLDKYSIEMYSEHLSFCSANGHMYDLMPIPFTYEAALYVAERVKQVQQIIERPLVLENVSYYAPLSDELSESDFINTVLDESGGLLLLDVNNVYVNSINHNYDAKAFIDAMPTNKIVYGHIAGHYNEAEDLIVDTHGADVIDPVWQLLAYAYERHGVFPTLLERDFNIPALDKLEREVKQIKHIQRQMIRAKQS